MDDGMGMHERRLWARIEGLQQALAEKDREIELADYTIKECMQKIVQQDTSYQQLMEKAVRFAQAYRKAHLSNWIDLHMAKKDSVYVAAQAFLKEREGT